MKIIKYTFQDKAVTLPYSKENLSIAAAEGDNTVSVGVVYTPSSSISDNETLLRMI